MSVSNDLFHDAMRDLAALGAHELVEQLYLYPRDTTDDIRKESGVSHNAPACSTATADSICLLWGNHCRYACCCTDDMCLH